MKKQNVLIAMVAMIAIILTACSGTIIYLERSKAENLVDYINMRVEKGSKDKPELKGLTDGSKFMYSVEKERFIATADENSFSISEDSNRKNPISISGSLDSPDPGTIPVSVKNAAGPDVEEKILAEIDKHIELLAPTTKERVKGFLEKSKEKVKELYEGGKKKTVEAKDWIKKQFE